MTASRRSDPLSSEVLNRAHWMTVRGDSMRAAGDGADGPSFEDGDCILVDPQGGPTPGRLVVVECGGRSTFRRLHDEAGRLWLQSLNPASPDALEPMPRDARIVGVVVGRFRWEPCAVA